jgi:hypothetical protein
MHDISPKARFDHLAGVLGFNDDDVSHVRNSIRFLLPSVNELVQRVDRAMQHDSAAQVLGELSPEQREKLQSVLASFVMRTIGCNFDEDYCRYAVEMSHGENIPRRTFTVGLSILNDFVASTLPRHTEDAEQLAETLGAWCRLIATLKELTRPA